MLQLVRQALLLYEKLPSHKQNTLHCVCVCVMAISMDSQYKRMILLPEPDYISMKHTQLNASNNKSELAWPSDISSEREQKLYALSLAKHREADTADPLPSSKRTSRQIGKLISQLTLLFYPRRFVHVPNDSTRSLKRIDQQR